MTIIDYAGPIQLPDTAYNMWVRGEIDDLLPLPEGSRVEIIGGEIVVSPAPIVEHGGIIRHITRALDRAANAEPSFPWACQQGTNINLAGIEQGYIPDLIVADEEILESLFGTGQLHLSADEVEMVVEVTSKHGADHDRPPVPGRTRHKQSKWWGYASVEIPYYLLVDCSPKVARTTLYSIPDQAAGAYLHSESWEFGETIRLPDPLGIDIDTSRWKPWHED